MRIIGLDVRAVILHSGDIVLFPPTLAYSLTSCFCLMASFFQFTDSL